MLWTIRSCVTPRALCWCRLCPLVLPTATAQHNAGHLPPFLVSLRQRPAIQGLLRATRRRPPAMATVTHDPGTAVARVAIEALRNGEASLAQREVEGIDPFALSDAGAARQAGGVCMELGLYRRAADFLRRSLQLDALASTRNELETAWAWVHRDIARGSLRAALRDVAQRINLPAMTEPAVESPRPAGTVQGDRHPRGLHLIGTLANLGGAERRILELFDLLSPHADVMLWSANGSHAPSMQRAIRSNYLTRLRTPSRVRAPSSFPDNILTGVPG